MAQRPLLNEDKLSPKVHERIAAFHAGTVSEVAAAVARDPVVVVGMAQNPFVKKVRKALTDAGIAFTYLEYGSYFSQWKPRLAIKMWSGWPTFPQVFVRGVLVGGFDDVVAGIADGSLKQRLG
ncbi:MAG TPA: glutaredoxin [Pseudomonadota bacterium]|nr:glutaredoxin [Pseudomonadota bacterium]